MILCIINVVVTFLSKSNKELGEDLIKQRGSIWIFAQSQSD